MANVTLDIPDNVLVKLKSGGVEPGKALCLAAAFSYAAGESCPRVRPRAWRG